MKKKLINNQASSDGFAPLVCIVALPIMLIAALIFATIGGGEDEGSTSGFSGSSDTVDSLDGAIMPYTEGKIGHEQHDAKADCFATGNLHYDGPESFFASVGSVSNCMAFGAPRTTDQERWYFNMRWDTTGDYPTAYAHKKVIITNPANGARVVASIEEYGPHSCLYDGDCEAYGFTGNTTKGMNAGASPEVYFCTETESPYTSDPELGKVQFGFAKDQSIPLGPISGSCASP